jgi:hypothetical protein
MTIKISVIKDKVVLQGPFHPDLPGKAKALGGKFQSVGKTWQFDAQDEIRVRALAMEVYGQDGQTPVDLVDVRLIISPTKATDRADLWRFGRLIAQRPTRDGAVRLGEGVVIVEGSFPASAGSQKYPQLMNAGYKGSVTVEVRGVPRTLIGEEDQIVEWSDQAPESPLTSIDTDLLIAEIEVRGYTVIRG